MGEENEGFGDGMFDGRCEAGFLLGDTEKGVVDLRFDGRSEGFVVGIDEGEFPVFA